MLTLLKRHWCKTTQPMKIMERSLLSMNKCFIPLLFGDAVINKQQNDLLLEWLKFLDDIFDLEISGIIYLRTTPDVSFQRIQTRNRPGENRITMDCLTGLHHYNDNWLNNESEIEVFQIKCEHEPHRSHQ